jgi:hypothetical protein
MCGSARSLLDRSRNHLLPATFGCRPAAPLDAQALGPKRRGPGTTVNRPQQEPAMIDLLDLFLIYCSATAHVCVQEHPTLDPPLTRFSQCETVGRAGDPQFATKHPDFALRSFTCALRPGTEA